MGMVVKPDSNVHQIRRQANRKNPERDTADRYRAVPSAFVSKGRGGDLLIPSWVFNKVADPQLGILIASMLDRIATLERGDAVAKGYAAPIEVNRPMTSPSKEQSVAHIAVSIPGNEAEQLTLPDVAPVIQPETVLLLPAPSKEDVIPLNLVRMPLQKAANDEVAPPVTPLPTEDMTDREFGKWLFDQFHFAEVESFRILDREFQARNKACLKTHGKTYDEVRIERKIKHLGLEKDALGNIVHRSDVLLPFESKYMDWIKTLPQLMEARVLRVAAEEKARKEAAVAAELARRAAMAITPQAIQKRKERAESRRASDIKARLPGVQFGQSVKFASVDQLAHDPVVQRSSATELRAYGLMFRDGVDWLRSKVGMDIPDRGAGVRGNVGWFLDDIHWLALSKVFPVDLPNPANELIAEVMQSSESVSQAELVRRYQRAGISH